MLCLFPTITSAQGLSIIRDTEIESVLQKWSEPVLKAAGLSNDQVRLVLVQSPEINAFVAGGANIFLYTGLIQEAEYPEEVIGVIAHEIGHITGGHLIHTRQAMERASFQSILATVLGVGAAIVSGDGGAAGAISGGGTGLATTGFLSHSRVQESAADQAALKYIEGTGLNPKGLSSFLEKLEGQELLPASQQSEYMRTHPLTRDRIDSMRFGAQQLPNYGPLGQSEKQYDFDLMKAKLLAFISPHLVPSYYDDQSGESDALYAHAIMNYRQSHFDKAMGYFDRLITNNPDSPFFLEMKAQALRDQGQLADSEKYYRQALTKLGGDAPLIQISLAHILIEQQQYTSEVESLLTSAIQNDSHETRPYRLMATLKGRQDKQADAQYFLAEEAIRQGRRQEAKRLVHLAKESGDLSSTYTLKANDLQIFLNGLPNRN